jgi:hypothetical protein
MTGQSFLELLDWHPRDVETLITIYEQRAEQREEQQRDARFAAATAELRQQMGRR